MIDSVGESVKVNEFTFLGEEFISLLPNSSSMSVMALMLKNELPCDENLYLFLQGRVNVFC